jgi:ketosteroid isomerase-like protein
MLARTLEDVQMPGEAKANEITPAFLGAFADAWNRHDVGAIMSAMTDDCVFEASAGVGVRGTVYDGQRQVQKGVERSSSNSPTRDGVDPSTSLRVTEV